MRFPSTNLVCPPYMNAIINSYTTKWGALDIQSQLQAINSLLQHVSILMSRSPTQGWAYTLSMWISFVFSRATICPTIGLFNNYRVQHKNKVLCLYKPKNNHSFIDIYGVKCIFKHAYNLLDHCFIEYVWGLSFKNKEWWKYKILIMWWWLIFKQSYHSKLRLVVKVFIWRVLIEDLPSRLA